jgi:FkbM family methyltransferase
MSLKSVISSLLVIRPLFLRLLKATARDVSIKNPWSGDRLFLNSFQHKGYWYFGKEREAQTMVRFRQLIAPGATVLEVGGHIGFISQYFAKLVGPSGHVFVFEPGTNNLPYLEQNTHHLAQVHVERQAVSNRIGQATFYQDNITGQNNSLLDDYKGAESVSRSHGMEVVKESHTVNLTTLDAFIDERGLSIDFVKIDIEGNEFNALLGAKESLKHIKALMIEVTEHQLEVFSLLRSYGFELSDESGKVHAGLTPRFNGNIFAIKQ